MPTALGKAAYNEYVATSAYVLRKSGLHVIDLIFCAEPLFLPLFILQQILGMLLMLC